MHAGVTLRLGAGAYYMLNLQDVPCPTKARADQSNHRSASDLCPSSQLLSYGN